MLGDEVFDNTESQARFAQGSLHEIRQKPAATANNIAASETLFGVATELVGMAGFIFVARALYDLLKGSTSGTHRSWCY